MNVARKGLLILGAALAVSWSATPSVGQTSPGALPAPGDTLRLTPSTAAESLLTAPITEPGERWTLTQAIQTALQRNADVHVARARVKQASGSALAAWNGILPSLITNLDYGYTKPTRSTQVFTGVINDSGGPVFGSNANNQSTTFTATASSNILSFPAISEKQRQDRLQHGTELDESETRNNVVYQVKQQYFEVLKAVRLAEVARQTEQLARDEETRAEALFQVGTVARGDVLKARARRANTTGDRIHAENQIDIQGSRLRQIIGVSPGPRIIPEGILDAGVVIPDSSESIKRALATRPRLESAKAFEQAAHSGLTSAQTVRLPKISGNFGWLHERDQQSFNNITGIARSSLDFEQTSSEWQGNVRASLPIFEGFLIEGNVRQAKGALLEAEAQRRQRELDVVVEVEQAWLNLRESVQLIDVAREGLASSEEDYKFSKGRYDLGAGTYLDLLTAEVNLANSKQTLIEAVANARVAEAGLEFAVGAKQY